MRETITNDQARRRRIRDVGGYRDPLPLEKLIELRQLWHERLMRNEYPADTCNNMIKRFEIRISKRGGQE